MNEDVSDLLSLGFLKVGLFKIMLGDLKLELFSNREDIGCYAFVKNGMVLYIGKTTNGLYARMNGYKNPGPTQQTNRRIKPKIMAAESLDIYFIPDSKILSFSILLTKNTFSVESPIDISSFECLLISRYKPEWNIK